MPFYLARPSSLHSAARVSSASSERGLQVAAPSPSGANAGTLHLRASGVPLAVVDAVVRLQTGGAPTGYANSDAGAGAGAAVVWRHSTDTTAQYRGYIDSIYLLRCEFPIDWSATRGASSTPRTLPSGKLGVLFAPQAGGSGTYTFLRWDGTTATSTFTASGLAANRPEFVVLGSGRLVAFVNSGTASDILSFYSDDNGLTWASLGRAGLSATASVLDELSAEVVGDAIVCVQSTRAGSANGRILVSRDGGSTFTIAQATQALRHARTCVVDDTVLVVSNYGSTAVSVFRVAPGGGLDAGVSTGLLANTPHCIVRRDDGTVWVYAFNSANNHEVAVAVSLDGGRTFASPTSSQYVADPGAAHATDGYKEVAAGVWRGAIRILGRVDATTGTDDSVHMLTFGGWESVTDVRYGVTGSGQPYEHTYLPIDYPDALGWVRSDVGAGATVTNTNALRFNSTAPNNTVYSAPSGFWGGAVGGITRRLRFRVRVSAGGAVATAAAMVEVNVTDGVNTVQIRAQFSTTGVRFVDTSGATIATVTLDQTGWVDWLVALVHNVPDSALVYLSVWHQKASETLWTQDIDNASHAEVVGTTSSFRVGGVVGATVDWEVAYIGVADDMDLLMTFVNPTWLAGRPLSASADAYVVDGVSIGGRNTGGVPGDTYDLDTGYGFARGDIWSELRPSRQWRTAADGVVAWVVFDAGASDMFRGDLVAVFGTNFRTATLQFSATDVWAAPTQEVALDATVATFTVGAGMRGPGYVGPTASANWRPGQYRSDGDSHRWFVEIASTVYEVTDNDEDRLYLDGVDLSAASGTARLFGDRMGAVVSFTQAQFMRLLIGGTQDTADGHFRVGTVIVDKRWSPAQLYDHGFVDRIAPTVEVLETDNGSRSSVRRGPRRETLAIQWPPLNRMARDVEARLRDWYRSIEGSHRPVVCWRDSMDQRTLQLVRVLGVYQGSNVWGEGATAVTRVDQLVLEEEQ